MSMPIQPQQNQPIFKNNECPPKVGEDGIKNENEPIFFNYENECPPPVAADDIWNESFPTPTCPQPESLDQTCPPNNSDKIMDEPAP